MKRGFTLIELLVVIAIIGMLSSVVLSSLNSARAKSRDARRLEDIRQIQTALEFEFDRRNNPEYPNNLDTLVTQAHLVSLPLDPITEAEYWYDNLDASDNACGVSSGVCTKYILGATLEVSTNDALSSDVDGTVGSVNCDDPVYCVRP